MPEIAGGVLGTVAGGKVAQMMGGGGGQPDIGQQITDMVNQQNKILRTYVDKAITSSTSYTNDAIRGTYAQTQQANNYLTSYLDKARDEAKMNTFMGLQGSYNIAQPYMQAGGKATDALQTSFGFGVPLVGTAALQDALHAKDTTTQARQTGMEALLKQFGGSAPTAPSGPAPTKPLLANTPNNLDNVIDYIAKNLYLSTDPASISGQGAWFIRGLENSVGARPAYDGAAPAQAAWTIARDPNVVKIVNPLSTQATYQGLLDKYNTQNQAYQTASTRYNNYTNQVNGLNAQTALTPMQQSILDAYNKGLFN